MLGSIAFVYLLPSAFSNVGDKQSSVQVLARGSFDQVLSGELYRLKAVVRGNEDKYTARLLVSVDEADLKGDERHIKPLEVALDIPFSNVRFSVLSPGQYGELLLCAYSANWLTGRNYLFLKSPSTWKAEEKAYFKELRSKDLKVTKAWDARENFQHSWSFDTRVGARSFFDQWHHAADATGLRPIQKVARLFLDHITGLLGYAAQKVTDAVTEGFNSKILMIKSAARGFRSFENFRVAILFHCEKLDLYLQSSSKNQPFLL